MSDGLVDVLIPVFNGSKTVRKAIETIQRQSVEDLRIFVVDDGSTDATPEILREIARTDPRVHVLTKENSGIVDALNLGLDHCRAEFVARHDADDLAYPTRFADQIRYLDAHPECVAVSGAARHIDEHDRLTGVVARLQSPSHADPRWVPSREPYLLHPFLMTRRSSIEGIHGYRHAYHAEDTDLYWRLQEIGKLENMETVVGEYRMHAQSITGASVLNGRIGALNSQLAAISALRRRVNRPDLTFPKGAIQEYRQAKSLPKIFEAGCRELGQDEEAYLRVALAAKMLELSAYRSFELEAEDCKFIHEALATHALELSPENKSVIGRTLSGTAARLAHAGMFSAAVTLLPLASYPTALARLAFRACVPQPVRRRVKVLRNRPDK
jgi:glycosyltransferase involved in cell wall biosynthesis